LKKIRLLQVTFDTEIKGYEIPAFRSAIIEKVGREHILFHNHLDKNFLYKYPVIQYKQIGRNPTIICVDFGVDEIHKYFENKSWDIEISGRVLEMKIKKLVMNQFVMNVWEKHFDYNIKNWIALNQENISKYLEIKGLSDRIIFLEKVLTANILSFAKGIEWTIEKPVEIKIKEILSVNNVSLKQKKMLGFDVDFSTNVFLPNFIGLGKSVSLGFGVVKSVKHDHYKQQDKQD